MPERVIFNSPQEERAYLEQAKKELDACSTKEEVIAVWRKHYLTLGHRKLGRLLLGRSIEELMRSRG